MVKSILVVCTGNTCRSPITAALLRDAVEKDPQLRRARLEVRSAGTGATDGDPATQLAIQAMKPYGLDLKEHQATRLSPDLVKWADLILTMTQGHRGQVISRFAWAASKTFILSEYVGAVGDVDDPLMAGTEDAYRRCADELHAYVPQILQRFREATQQIGSSND